MPRQHSGLNPGRAGPKGALAEKPAGRAPRSGPSGAEGNNTRRDFVRGKESKKTDRSRSGSD
jgi:hypothetical protein